MNQNQNTDIKSALDRQESLLRDIAMTQTEILAVEKQRLRTEQYQVIGKVAHAIFWILILWFSFVQIQKLTNGMMEKFTMESSPVSESANFLNGAKTTTNLLSELLSY